ncbi:MAG TPA: hypothetical protein PK026_04710 [Bacteroides graminisolvens]|nr:hypothetical protein [Bacteroides graminisolvens]
MKRILLYFALLLFAAGCAGGRKMVNNESGQQLTDSILQYSLDHEALYTLLGSVKPMSSLVSFSFPIANLDSTKKASEQLLDPAKHQAHLIRLLHIQQAVNGIHIPDVKIVMVPYKAPYRGKRNIQISAVRISMLDSLLRTKSQFFGQFGLVPGADPTLVVSTIENADTYERLRGYGYLFGYPDYAVDFFVKASQEADLKGQFIERNFFQIPTYARSNGYFVYAYPKDMTPSAAVDSVLYHKAVSLLDKYKAVRNHYLNADSTLSAYKLILEYHRKSKD